MKQNETKNKKKKESTGHADRIIPERNAAEKAPVKRLMQYAGRYRGLTVLGLVLSSVAMIASMIPYLCIWLVVRELLRVAPDWTQAGRITTYGWMAFVFAAGGIMIYFVALVCTHLAAFRTAANIRKQGMAHLMKTPIGYFDRHASGLLKNRLDGAAGDTETLLAHNLADVVGTIAMLAAMITLLFVFDWRMGSSCLFAAVISVLAMFSMMNGKNAGWIAKYQEAQDRMSRAGTEYVRGIPVVKVFQQTIYSFRAFRQSIDEYSDIAEHFEKDICRLPQSVNLTFTEGSFVFLVPVACCLAPGAVLTGQFLSFLIDFSFYAVFSAILSTALARVMFAANGNMLAQSALDRIDTVMRAPVMPIPVHPERPHDQSVSFEQVSFTYHGAARPALQQVTFHAEPGQTVALVGPSGGGKTTAASLIPRFWDATERTVCVGGVDVRKIHPHHLMEQIAFVFQHDRLFKTSILENVRAVRPNASRSEVEAALSAAQCDAFLSRLPRGVRTEIGTKGTWLSGGEQQRIALARAILKDAPIVVLDEATAFADPENEVLIQQALSALTRDRTVIMIAHRLSSVTGADKIVVLDEGRVVEQGTHASLQHAGGLYESMWRDYQQACRWQIDARVR